MQGRPRVVIIGAGFGGLLAARKLHRANADITVIDRTNHHLFQPLLYQVATAALAPTDITGAIRHTLRRQRNTSVVLGEVGAVDVAQRTVTFHDPYIDGPTTTLPYDYLIIAAGTRHSYFAHPEWEQFAPGLKTIVDAIEMRRRFLLAFEEAERATTPAARKAWLTFVVVGGGPTGCELAGVMQEVAHAMRKDFRYVDTRETSVILLEAGPRILPAFPVGLAEHARRDLTELDVDVRTSCAVTDVRADLVRAGDLEIPTHTVFWAAGNVGASFARSFGAPVNRAGQVIVEPDLSIPGHPEVFVIGDLAFALQNDGQPAPGAPGHPAIMMQRAVHHDVKTTGCAYGDKAGYQALVAYLDSLKTWSRK